jgi:8-oxo-dGTP pyrophosphatase MutT (NUDIX family)
MIKNRHVPKEKAGVVVYRQRKRDEPLVLVVSARKLKSQWVFPVGSVKKDESLEAAAKRECEEESGYQVDIGIRLPSIQLLENGTTKRFTFFLAEVVGETDQWEMDRKRRWLPVSQIADALPDVFQFVAREAVAHILRQVPMIV